MQQRHEEVEKETDNACLQSRLPVDCETSETIRKLSFVPHIHSLCLLITAPSPSFHCALSQIAHSLSVSRSCFKLVRKQRTLFLINVMRNFHPTS